MFIVLLCLANQTGGSSNFFDDRLDMKANRDHDRHHTNESLTKLYLNKAELGMPI